MKKLTIFLMLITIIATGCTGTFQLTRKVYDFQTSPKDKWVDEVLFLAFVIIPVYGASTLVDAVVFNSLEFWTGENPMTASLRNTHDVIAQNDQGTMKMKFDADSQNIEVTSTADPAKSFVLARTDNGVTALNREGEVLFTSVEDSSGGVTVFDADNNAVRHFSSEEVQKGRSDFFTR